MDPYPRDLRARESKTRLLPLDRVSARPLAGQQRHEPHARTDRCRARQGEEARLARSARAGTGPWFGYWRSGTFGGLFPGFDGAHATARDRLRTAIRVRDV